MNNMNFTNITTIGETCSFLEKAGYSLLKIYPVNHYLVNQGKGPCVTSFFDGLWIPEKSLDLPKEYLYKELLLHAAFGVCFTNRCIQIINQVPGKQAISKL